MIQFGYTIVYVVNVAESLAFFQAAFGLPIRFLHESGQYGELDTGATCLAFADHTLAEQHFVGGVQGCDLAQRPLGIEIALITTTLEQTHQHALAQGALELAAPCLKPWGQTVSYLRSPDGVLIELCTPISSV